MFIFTGVGIFLSVALILLDISNIFEVGGLFNNFKPMLWGLVFDAVVFVLLWLFSFLLDKK